MKDMKAAILCWALAALCVFLAGMNLGLFIAHGESISVISCVWALLMGAWTGFNALRITVMDVEMRESRKRWASMSDPLPRRIGRTP